MENKKTKAKNYYQANKEKLQKRSRKYYRNFSEEEKIKREIMLTIKTKIWQAKVEKEKKNTRKIIIIKEKNY